MKLTRKNLISVNAQLMAQLSACGPDETMSRKQLRARLQSARAEIDALTARVSALTAQVNALQEANTALKSQAKQSA